MKAVWNKTIIAEAEKEDLIRIEGNWYFPPTSIRREYFTENDHHTICPWKGVASYYDVVIDGQKNSSAAWYYHTPKEGSVNRVKKDFKDYVAFWNGITVVS
jgi:uncharacterized protein (DUF427 family)